MTRRAGGDNISSTASKQKNRSKKREKKAEKENEINSIDETNFTTTIIDSGDSSDEDSVVNGNSDTDLSSALSAFCFSEITECNVDTMNKLQQYFDAKLGALTKVIDAKDKTIAKLNQKVGFLKSEVGSLKSEVDNLKKSCSNMTQKTADLETVVDECNAKHNKDLAKVMPLKSQVEDLQDSYNFMSKETSDLKMVFEDCKSKNEDRLGYLCDKTADLEDRSRRDNLVFFGVKELSDKRSVENCEIIITELLIQQGIIIRSELKGDLFDRAHRLGPRKNGVNAKPRPIICKFTSYKDKVYVLSNSFKMKGTSFGIAEDFSKTTLDIRGELVAKAKAAKNICTDVQGFRLSYRRLSLKYEDPVNKNVYYRSFSLSDILSNSQWYLPREKQNHNI